MSLWLRDGFEDCISGLPATAIVRQWGDASVAKVGGKVFALFGPEGPGLVFKVSELAFDMLTAEPGIIQAPYFGRGWVRVGTQAPLAEEDLRAYLGEAHRQVASKLTRKLRAELGLGALIAAGPHRS